MAKTVGGWKFPGKLEGLAVGRWVMVSPREGNKEPIKAKVIDLYKTEDTVEIRYVTEGGREDWAWVEDIDRVLPTIKHVTTAKSKHVLKRKSDRISEVSRR